MLKCLYYLQKNYRFITLYDTPYAEWIFLEVQVFVSWILSSFAFLFVAYCTKYRSLWAEANMKRTEGKWHHKDSNDYLDYLKYEYKAFCLGLTFLFFSLINLAWLSHPANDKLDSI